MMHPREAIVVGPLAAKIKEVEIAYADASRPAVTAAERLYWRNWFSLMLKWRREQREFWEGYE